jgi:regulator of protease activity HflC (stomatin/prohibitin superfamily)
MNPLLMSGALGAGAVVAVAAVLLAVFRAVAVEVEDEEVVIVTRHGKLLRRLETAGLHVVLDRALPWVTLQRVSLARDFRHFSNVHVNDARGTTVMVDLWVELRVKDPVKVLFSVDDWDRSLQNLVSHAATSIMGNREFQEILRDRTELGRQLQQDISAECERWGIQVEMAFVRNVTLLPDVSRQIFDAISARLERAKADIEEAGRLAVAQLEADTSVRIAGLVAEAKGQYPLAIGRAYAALRRTPRVLAAYESLYGLNQLRPQRTIAFRGFSSELRGVDAAMMPTHDAE